MGLHVDELLFSNFVSRPCPGEGKEGARNRGCVFMPTAEFSSSSSSSMRDFWNGGAAAANRERESLILPSRRSRRKGKLFKGRSRVTPRPFPEIGGPAMAARTGANSKCDSGARKLNGVDTGYKRDATFIHFPAAPPIKAVTEDEGGIGPRGNR